MSALSAFPALNASLNFVTACLLLVGHRFMKQGAIQKHRATMLAAFATSLLFLISYLWYHAHAGSTPYPGSGWPRRIYLGILLSHTGLAATVPFLALVTLARGLKDRIPQHRRIARLTYPIWLYVSATGVIIYVMLYRPWR